MQVSDLVKCYGDTAERMPNAQFIKVKPRPQPRAADTSQRCSDTEEEPVGDILTVPLFYYLEEGCVKTYQRFSLLQHHLDLGKHERALENETLLDRAVLGYADRLQEQFCGIPQIQVRKCLNLTTQSSLPMGWALKSSHVRRTRFTEKQKDYLTSKFHIGETTGQKVDVLSVAKSMISARDSNGNCLFASSEFLTGEQVSSFFSRLASKHTLENDKMTGSDIEENQNVEDEEAFSEMRSKILQKLPSLIPTAMTAFTFCELIADSKLSKFAIQMLQNICEHFDIKITNIKMKRKAPYIERLIAFGKKCTCQGTCRILLKRYL